MSARHTSPLQALLIDPAFDGEVYDREPMKRHTTYRIGGPARYYVRANSLGALTSLIDRCNEANVAWVVIGGGSNLLVSDKGFDGVVISLGRDFRTLKRDDEQARFFAGAGVKLATVVTEAFTHNYEGLEFAVGTPGTVGGALRMNAGTRDRWIGELVESVTYLEEGKRLTHKSAPELFWEYRRGPFSRDDVILECSLKVTPADPFYIRGKMEANLARRKRNQPLQVASCGSVFKNPPGESAAALIEACNLKGTRVGGACISELHANFIINDQGASAQDVCDLMVLAQTKVREVYGIELQPEVRFLGFDEAH